MAVSFSGRVRDELPKEIRAQLSTDLPRVFDALEPKRKRQSIAVPRLFAGHTPEFHEKVVLAVEVTYSDGYECHIVKIGRKKRVEPDYTGWLACTKGRMVASRIFAPVRKVGLAPDRVAVVYRDGFALYGPDSHDDPESQPKSLSDAIKWAVLDDKPDPLSAERAIAHVFTDLGLWFYRGASSLPTAAWKFYAMHLRCRSNEAATEHVLARWQDDLDRRTLRRHAVWVLAGRDAPDSDPIHKPARYLDPIEFVTWAMAARDGSRIPSSLVGRSHGDLHALNILVGVRRGEVQYPAVFDYGDMSDHNVLAWDFAKLESELKVRLLPTILEDRTVLTYLTLRSKLRSQATRPKSGLESRTANRADRLAAFLAFEELLDDLTSQILVNSDAERIAPLERPPTGVSKLDRLAAILLRVRREAAKWLGFVVPKRQMMWKNDLYFALAVYGLINVRWDYTPPEQEAALVSAGVALARMPVVPTILQTAIAAGARHAADSPSYRVPLAILYDIWKTKQFKVGCDFSERLVLKATRRDTPSAGSGNQVSQFEVRPTYYHAIPLIGQAILLETEVGELHAAEGFLEGFRTLAIEFHDFETLGRIGRLFKESGDRAWEAWKPESKESETPAAMASTRPAYLQMYDKALDVYSEAFDATGDWYVGINAATLALLTGNQEKAVSYARAVAKTCAENRVVEKKDRYWLYVTEGEAALILSDLPNAKKFYDLALAELTPGQWGMANSTYRQACRLWKFWAEKGDHRVDPILASFEKSDARSCLQKQFLGRKFPEES